MRVPRPSGRRPGRSMRTTVPSLCLAVDDDRAAEALDDVAGDGRPRPEPVRRVVKKGSNTRGRSSGAIPAPRSTVSIRQRSPARRDVVMRISGPSGRRSSARTACCALVSTLTRTDRSRSASVRIGAAAGSASTAIGTLSASGRDRPRGVGADLAQVGGRQVEADRLGEVEHVRDDAVQARDFLVDARGDLGDFGGGVAMERPQVALDDHQRIANLVRDDGGEPAERRQALALGGLALEALQRSGELAERRRQQARVFVVPAAGHRRGAREVAGRGHLAHRRGERAERPGDGPGDQVADDRGDEHGREARDRDLPAEGRQEASSARSAIAARGPPDRCRGRRSRRRASARGRCTLRRPGSREDAGVGARRAERSRAGVVEASTPRSRDPMANAISLSRHRP